MPPSSHYLNLLNLNQQGDEGHADLYTADDLTKELELFTNSSFLDQEAAFYPTSATGAYGPAPFDLHVQQQQQQAKRSQLAHIAAAQDASFAVADGLTLNYMLNQPAAALLPAADAPSFDGDSLKRKYAAFDSADHSSGESPATPGGSRSAKSLGEEDKRRRNTQASARFRVKKKQREQALQENARQMNDKCSSLESRVKELELENKWLRNLLKPADAKQASSVFGARQENA